MASRRTLNLVLDLVIMYLAAASIWAVIKFSSSSQVFDHPQKIFFSS